MAIKNLFYLLFIFMAFLLSEFIYGFEVFAQKVEPAQVPLIVDLKVNGSDGHVNVFPNDTLQVSWTSQGFTNPDPIAPCSFDNYPVGSSLGNISSLTGRTTISYSSIVPPRTITLTLTCFNGLRTTAGPPAPSASDSVTIIVTEPAANSTSYYSQDLYFGLKNSQVTQLQQDLATDAVVYPEKLITGYFGPLTLRAVKRFQAKHGIRQTGYVGPITRGKLKELYVIPNARTLYIGYVSIEPISLSDLKTKLEERGCHTNDFRGEGTNPCRYQETNVSYENKNGIEIYPHGYGFGPISFSLTEDKLWDTKDIPGPPDPSKFKAEVRQDVSAIGNIVRIKENSWKITETQYPWTVSY